MQEALLKLAVLCLLIQGAVLSQNPTGVRIAYINSVNNFNPATGRPSVPVTFLERAKRDNYTHIMVEFGIPEPGDWDAIGNYLNRSYNGGDLYLTLKEIMDTVHASGLKIIPYIATPGLHGVYAWWPAIKDTNGVDCYYSVIDSVPLARLPCLASGLVANGVTLQPNGFNHIFSEAMKVLHQAYSDAHYSENLDYVCIGYSECFHQNTMIWGTQTGRTNPLRNATSIDQIWMNQNNRNLTQLAIASIKQRVNNIRTGNTLFNSTKVMIFGDMFSNTFQNAKGRVNVVTTNLPDSADQDFKDKVVVIPWWYFRNKVNNSDFNTEAMLREFTDNQIQTIFFTCMSENAGEGNDNVEDTWVIPSYTYELFEYLSVAKNIAKSTNMLIGYGAAHWAMNGYNSDLLWNTMEYLAYGNQVARPQTQFSIIPPGVNVNDNVKIRRLLCSQTEITQGDYLAVTGKYIHNANKFTGRLDHPAENLTKYDAVIYCNERSIKEGLTPVYSYDTPQPSSFTGDFKETCNSLSNLNADTSKNGYRLPSYSEWQFIYRANTTTVYYWGNTVDTSYYWCNIAPQVTMPVRLKKPNGWNIYDIAGNVEEWTCNYTYSSNLVIKYTGGSITDYASNPVFKYTSRIADLGGRGSLRIVRKAPDITPILNLLLSDSSTTP